MQSAEIYRNDNRDEGLQSHADCAETGEFEMNLFKADKIKMRFDRGIKIVNAFDQMDREVRQVEW